ncbi:DUF2130 domain-containing protein [Gammaproteobacteria bacterium]|nr:DUF2130 domain-containing protein [Gammaproteobacteria bacterium]
MNVRKHAIHCPNCATEIDIESVLYQQMEGQLRGEYQHRFAQEKEALSAQQSALQTQQRQLATERAEQQAQVEHRLQQAIKEREKTLGDELKRKITTEQAELLGDLQKELNEKSDQLKDFNRARAEVERLKREQAELGDKLRAESEKKLNEQVARERERIRQEEDSRHELRLRELQMQLEDQKRLTEEMKRKQEQGSMQTQGEVQELAIEDWLHQQFPIDTIEEIKKGERGADCLQIVHTRSRQNCGSIYYESKRTKAFQPAWIEKFKADIQSRGANLGVLVTAAMPNGMERMGLVDGVWVCSFDEFKGLCTVLRESLIQISRVAAVQENKGEKMDMLYHFLTGPEFQMQIEAIVDGFTQMKIDLDKEKNAMQRIWKTREKQIEKVLTNTTGMYGSIRGIAGSAVGSVKALEWPEDDEDD